VGDIGYLIYKKDSFVILHLIYRLTNKITGEIKELNYAFPVQHTTPYFGGKRYWFICPLATIGKTCLKRVGKLYLPPDGQYFGCRQCYDLVYLSSRESHKWDNFWRSLGVEPSIGKTLERRLTKSNNVWN